MTKTTFTIDIVPPGAAVAGQIKLTLNATTLDPSLYDHWMLAGSRLRSLSHAIIPEGNFILWHRWSLQCERDPISATKAHHVWESLPIVEVPNLRITAEYSPKPIDPTQPVLASTTRNAVGQVLDRYTEERCGQLYISDIAELQRELVELIEAAKG